MNLDGKTVLVIGAGRGIGRCSAELFSNAGANIVLSSRNEAELMELEYKLNSRGNPNVAAITADASVKEDVKLLVEQTIKKFETIDYLVLAAGQGILKPFGELTLEDFDALINANTRTAFTVLQEVLPVMKEQKFGRVVAIPGILGKASDDAGFGLLCSEICFNGNDQMLKRRIQTLRNTFFANAFRRR